MSANIALFMSVMNVLILDTVLNPISTLMGSDHDIVRKKIIIFEVAIVLLLIPMIPCAVLSNEHIFPRSMYDTCVVVAVAMLGLSAALPTGALFVASRVLLDEIERVLETDLASATNGPNAYLFVHIERLLQARVYVYVFFATLVVGDVASLIILLVIGTVPYNWLMWCCMASVMPMLLTVFALLYVKKYHPRSAQMIEARQSKRILSKLTKTMSASSTANDFTMETGSLRELPRMSRSQESIPNRLIIDPPIKIQKETTLLLQ